MVTCQSAIEAVKKAVAEKTGGYVCFSNVHTVVEAESNSQLKIATNAALLACPDGKPLSIYAKLAGEKDVEQVSGPDFLPYIIEKEPELSHFFMGSTEDTLKELVEKLKEKYPRLIIAGSYSPPFAPMDGEVNKEIIAKIKAAKADLVWVGLGAPKQEVWMCDNWAELSPSVLMGVGAAFDFHSGKTKRAPKWMRAISLEWLHRLASEPRRLWKRYLITNSKFIYLVIKKLVTGSLIKYFNQSG